MKNPQKLIGERLIIKKSWSKLNYNNRDTLTLVGTKYGNSYFSQLDTRVIQPFFDPAIKSFRDISLPCLYFIQLPGGAGYANLPENTTAPDSSSASWF